MGAVCVASLAYTSCGKHDGEEGDSEGSGGRGSHLPSEPTPVDPGAYSYALSESSAELELWTSPATRKPTIVDRAPEGERHSGLRMSAARNEFEPVQLVLGPGTGTVQIDLDGFAELGPGSRLELAVAEYRDGWADTLTPIAAGDAVERAADAGTPLWLTVYVPEDAPAGDHTGMLTLTPQGGAPLTVPISLYVFDFTLPREIHFATQLNVSVEGLIPPDGDVDDAKTLLFEHRMTPKSVTWPSGFSWNITWDTDRAPDRCQTFYDEPDEAPAYSIRHLAARYIQGDGWNDVGFPNAMLFQFVDNSTPRPAEFCGVPRGDHYGSTAYNAEWSAWLAQLDDYLVAHDYAQKAYYYVQNEPQNDEDHALAAHLCTLTRAAAPHLRLAISEEPKPEIADTCGYDIWIAHVRAYEQSYAWERQRDHAEEVWYYSLDHDPDPYFNPTDIERPGMHQRVIPWAAWSHRIRGWAYYDGGRFFAGHLPTIRAELLREGFEDYEYLWLANGGAHPTVDETRDIDATVASVAASMTSWTQDANALLVLRHELGRYLEGSRDTLPTLEVESSRPPGAYYLNFQDPEGEPRTDPLVVNAHEYLKIGWEPYDATRGYGWSGEYIDDLGIALYGYDETDGYDVRQQSYVYDDYGRDNLFEFDLAPGTYAITVGVGRPARGYADPSNVSVEGVPVIDDEITTDAAPTIVRTVELDVTDGRLSIVVAGRSASTGDYAYTFLSFIDIEPVE